MNFIIPLVVYPFDVMVSVNETDKQLLTAMLNCGAKRYDCNIIMKLPSTCRGRAAMLPTNQTVIRLMPNEGDSENTAVIAHEVFHAVTFIMQRIGMPFEIGVSDEAYAYLIGYIVREITEKLKI